MAELFPPTLSSSVAGSLREAARRQAGVFRRQALVELGVTDRQLDWMLESNRWQCDAGGLVIVMHNGPLTSLQEESVAVLAGGRLCALAARSAATRCGLVGWEPELVEILVPRGTTYPRLGLVGVKVHESRRFGPDDVHVAAWPPRVSVDRALVDAAVWSKRPRTACGVLAAGVQQRLTVAPRLLEELERAGAVRHRSLLRHALADIDGGAHAMSEIDFTRFCARNGLPKPVHQVVRRDASGRRRYLDATLVGPTGRVVRVEIDGALHLVVQTYWSDMYRGNDLSIARETALRFPSFVIYADDSAALGQLRAALGLSGPQAIDAA